MDSSPRWDKTSAIPRFADRCRFDEEKVAVRKDLDPTYISGIERGLRNPGIKNVARLARVLGLTTAKLCRGVDA